MGTGTGKTFAAICAALQLLGEKKITDVLVAAPKAVEPQFRKHVKELDDHMESRWQLVSYERFKRGHAKVNPGTLLILDEAHNLRNSSNITAQAVAKAAEQCKFVIALTATPMVNGPQDLHMLLRILTRNKRVKGLPSTQKGWEGTYGFDAANCEKGKDAVIKAFRRHTHYYFKEQSEFFPTRRLQTNTDVHLHTRQTRALVELSKKENAGEAALAMLQRLGGKVTTVDEVRESKYLNAYLNKARQAALVDHGQACSTKVQSIVRAIKKGPKPAVVFIEFRASGIDQIEACL